MRYTHKYTTLWHDTDACRVLRAGKIQTYFQETGNLQCKAYGVPLDELRDERGVGFILSKISVKVYKPIGAYKDIEVDTWCKEAKGYSFYRYFEMRSDGDVVARASSVWALVDINTHSLARGDDELASHFPYDEPISATDLPQTARIGRGEVLYPVGKREIKYSDIDYNMHMNNTNYPDMLCDFLPDMQGKYVSEFSLSYLKESHFGTTLSIMRGEREDKSFIFKTQNPDGDTCLEAVLKLENI